MVFIHTCIVQTIFEHQFFVFQHSLSLPREIYIYLTLKNYNRMMIINGGAMIFSFLSITYAFFENCLFKMFEYFDLLQS